MLDELVPDAAWGNRTSIEIDASAQTVWDSLEGLTLGELRVTRVLMAARSLPAIIRRKGSLNRTARRGDEPRPDRLIDALAGSRFRILHEERGRVIVLGTIGQFWKPSGGDIVEFDDREGFLAFDRPGFVKAAIGFVVQPARDRTILSTETRNQTTSEDAARTFARYWRLVGWGSKVTRLDMLRAVRRRAERAQ